MGTHFTLTVHPLARRYHGAGEWPPAPARVFQALVAGVARGQTLSPRGSAALAWLETLPPPIIAAPPSSLGQEVATFVPNNDADSVGGDPDRIAEIRTLKSARPRLLDTAEPFIYAWPLDSTDGPVEALGEAAGELYQLGRGVDPAWAVGEVLDEGALVERLRTYRGEVHRPSASGSGAPLACPTLGSLASLIKRYAEASRRLQAVSEGGQHFAQPPKARFVLVPYDSPARRQLYDLRRTGSDELFAWPIARVVQLVERLRDGAATRLRDALPEQAALIERTLIGRKADGADAGPTLQRIRIVPLPSIGHQHADRDVRRVLVEVPPGGGLAAGDVFWAFSSLETHDPETGELDGCIVTAATETTMLRHYTPAARRWYTVTPAALPENSGRRRIDPARRGEDAKPAAERLVEEGRAATAVATALRHAGICASLSTVQVQREPFEERGSRAERFAAATRFGKERLWHIKLELDDEVDGPLLLGDGRFLGLGIFAPVREVSAVYAFAIEGGLEPKADPLGIARALRRAVMARVQAQLRGTPLAPFFSGHAPDGPPATSADERHIAFQAELPDRLLVIAPHLVHGDREPRRVEREQLEQLAQALHGLVELRAGAAGLLALRRAAFDIENDRLTRLAQCWQSVNSFTVNRHAKRPTAEESVAHDVKACCRARGLPAPLVTIRDARGVPGLGLQGLVTLEFPVAVPGPIVLGRTRHIGGGLFVAADCTKHDPGAEHL
jgi:CRISPR-associated protein Csb2